MPHATRELLLELDGALGDSGPLQLGVPPRQWLRGHERLSGAVRSLRDDPVEVQLADAERGLGAARDVFRLAALSVRWRRWSGGTRRALRVQFATLALLAVIVGAVLESVFQPGGFHLIILVVGPIVFGAVWGVPFRDTTARLGDAVLAREAAKAVTDDQRVLVGLRLVPRTDVEVLIATDREVIAAQPVGHGRWGITW